MKPTLIGEASCTRTRLLLENEDCWSVSRKNSVVLPSGTIALGSTLTDLELLESFAGRVGPSLYHITRRMGFPERDSRVGPGNLMSVAPRAAEVFLDFTGRSSDLRILERRLTDIISSACQGKAPVEKRGSGKSWFIGRGLRLKLYFKRGGNVLRLESVRSFSPHTAIPTAFSLHDFSPFERAVNQEQATLLDLAAEALTTETLSKQQLDILQQIASLPSDRLSCILAMGRLSSTDLNRGILRRAKEGGLLHRNPGSRSGWRLGHQAYQALKGLVDIRLSPD